MNKLAAQGVARDEARAAARDLAAELGVAWEGDDFIEDD